MDVLVFRDAMIFCNNLGEYSSESASQRRIFVSLHTIYGSQTKVLERVTRAAMRVFEVLFRGCEYSIWGIFIEKSIEHSHCSFLFIRPKSTHALSTFVSSRRSDSPACLVRPRHMAWPRGDPGSMVPKRRFGKQEQTMMSGFSIDFSMVRSPNRVLTPAEKGLEIAHFIFGNSFQNLRVWDA